MGTEKNTLDMVKAAASAAMSRRAQDGVILDLRKLDGFTDFFAIFSGASDIQVEGISQAVIEELETNWEQRPWHQEGERKADWILLDYVDFVVHVFLSDRRSYYNLERLWAEANRIELPELAMPIPQETWKKRWIPMARWFLGNRRRPLQTGKCVSARFEVKEMAYC